MKFCFNGGGFHELTQTLKHAGHTVGTGFPHWNSYTHSTAARKQYNVLLKAAVAKAKPDVYVCTKGFRNGPVVFPETTEWIQKNSGVTIFWSQDDPFFTPTFVHHQLYRGYTLALSCSTGSFNSYKKHGVDPYLFWPAWDSTVFKNIKPVPEKDKVDIVFVGTPYACTNIPRKDILLWAVQSGLSVEIYGSKEWITNSVIKRRNKPFIQGDIRLAPYYKGVWKTWETLPSLFCKARINVSNHVQTAPMYLNDRMFLTMGPGNCLVADINPGIDKVFKHNKEIVFYKDWETFKHRAMFYLKNEYSRKQICENAKKKILNEHTYKCRAHQMLDIVKKYGIK